MAGETADARRSNWTDSLPVLRLLRTFKLAITPERLGLALAAVVACYLVGRLLDSLWLMADAGVVVQAQAAGRISEIEAFDRLGAANLPDWKQAASAAGRSTADAARTVEQAVSADEVKRARDKLDELRNAALDALRQNTALSASERKRQQDELRRAIDSVRLMLAGRDAAGGVEQAVGRVLQLASEPAARTTIESALRRQQLRADARRSSPRGPFAALLDYECGCFAAAVRGVACGNWSFSSAAAGGPGMLSSIASGGNGVIWVVTQRPLYALCYGFLHLAVFALLGGAICRHAAIQLTRDENPGWSAAVRFARQKYMNFLLAPLSAIGLILIGGCVISVVSLIGALPWLGELAAGVSFGLTLVGGVVLALLLIATVLGFPLFAPTIATEGSDMLDAVSRAFNYVSHRFWSTVFYCGVLLIYGGVCFIGVRLVALLALKLSNDFAGAGMDAFWWNLNAGTDTVGKLEAMWRMPAWGELSLLPAAGGEPFWGSFFNAPLSMTETIAAWMIAAWVFLVVGLVGAFAVSFYLCGSSAMYLLLRREVDATEYEEIFYEEEADNDEPDAEPKPPAPGDAGPRSTPLPVVGAPPGDAAH
ncbi:hypothetical protein RAS1_02900 [Phycisphaerae bacterium RAS1]|nr:hypothetical protein RAS1_02900 [Phycisphaerae bacterium RAS1]